MGNGSLKVLDDAHLMGDRAESNCGGGPTCMATVFLDHLILISCPYPFFTRSPFLLGTWAFLPEEGR